MPSTVDPNIYSLSIALALDGGAASTQWADFTGQALAFEKKVVDVAKASLATIMSVVDEVGKSITALSSSTTDLGVNSKDITDAYKDGNKQLEDTDDYVTDRLKDADKMLIIMEDMHDLDKKNEKIQKGELDRLDTMLASFDTIVKAVKVKNDQHRLQGQLLNEDNNYLDQFNRGLGDTVRRTGHINRAWMRMSALLRTIAHTIVAIDDDTENFVRSNYRAYGSQQELVGATRDLSMEWGVTKRVATEAYQVMMDLKLPKQELEKYAAAVAKSNRFLGTSVQVMGQYAARMRGMGHDADYVERKTIFLSNAMRKFGLAAHDVDKILQGTASNASDVMLAFGGTQASIEGFEQAKMALMAVNKEMGVSTDVADKFMNSMANDMIMRMKIASLAGMQINNEMDLHKALVKSGKALRDRGIDIDGLAKKAQQGDMAAQKLLEVYAKVYTNGDKDALLMLGRVGKLAEQMGVQGDRATDLLKITQAMRDQALDPWAESNDTLTAQLRILSTSIKGITETILQLAADALVPIFKTINAVVTSIGYLIKKWKEFYGMIEKVPGLGLLAKGLKWLAGIAVIAGVAIITLGAGLASLAVTIAMAVAAFTTSIPAITAAVTALITTTVQAFAAGFIAIMTAIGRGLQQLGNAIRTSIIPLLGLGVALVIVAGAAYIFASAVKIIADSGDNAITAIISLTLATVILGAALVGLGMLAQGPVAGGILIVASAMLILGAASIMAGYGIQLAGYGLQLMAAALSGTNAGTWLQLFVIAGGLASLGLASLIAAPGIVALSAALVIAAGAAWLVGESIQAIAMAIHDMDITVFADKTKQLSEASVTLMLAATRIATAGSAILAGSVMLGIGLTALGAMSVGMDMIGSALEAAGNLLLPGATMVFQSAMYIKDTSDILYNSASSMLTGSGVLVAAAIGLAAAGAGMVVAGGLLLAGSVVLAAGAWSLAFAASGLMRYGPKIEQGAASVANGVDLLDAASLKMVTVGDRVWGASTKLKQSVASFKDVVWSLSQVAVATAAISLAPADAVANIADRIAVSTPKIDAASNGLALSAVAFRGAVDQFKLPATELIGVLRGIIAVSNDLDGINLHGSIDKLTGALTALNAVGDVLSFDKFHDSASRLVVTLKTLEQAIGSLSHFGDDLAMADGLAKLSADINKYTSILETAADRLDRAVNEHVIPSVHAIDKTGIKEAIMPETINTVKVMTEEEGAIEAGDSTAMESLSVLRNLAEIARIISDKIPPNMMTEMLTCLQDIADIDDSKNPLISSMANWNRS